LAATSSPPSSGAAPGPASRRGPRTPATSLLDDREDVAGRQDQVLLAVDLDLGAAVLGVDDGVPDAHVERNAVALLEPARAHRHDRPLLGLLLGRVGDHEAAGGRLLALTGLDDDPVLQRVQLELRHRSTSFVRPGGLALGYREC
jgi:hypothetical protein